jgi:hypothetical protein
MKPAVPFNELKFDLIPKDQLSRIIEATQFPSFTNAKTWRDQVGAICLKLRDMQEGKRL